MKPLGSKQRLRGAWVHENAHGRAKEKRQAEEEAKDQLASELHRAELELIACDAGDCPLGCLRSVPEKKP